MIAPDRTLRVLTGCSASGKTEWALRWAGAFGAEIISCDSGLFYKGMDIGAAKPTPEERSRVPHHLIDVLPVDEPMDVARYAEMARSAAEEIAARGRPVLVCGGSGFYLKSFFAAVADEVRVAPELRRRVAERLAAGGLPALVDELRRLNPGGLGGLDTANPRRVTRALERCLASGRPLGELAAEFAGRSPPFEGWRIELARLDRPAAEIDARIAKRVEGMLEAGLVGEVRALAAAGLGRNPSASKAIGYREAVAMLEGRLAPEVLASEIVRNTRALVKKQRTWFRTQLPPHRVLEAGALRDPSYLFPVSPA